MVFGFFKKRDRGILDQVKTIQSSLKSSFINVKQDMHNISSWINVMQEKDEKQDQQISYLRKRIILLEAKLERVVEDLEEEEILEEPTVEQIRETPKRISGILSSFQSLTATQRNIFKTLYFIQKEKGWTWVLLKDIANEIYPTKSYNAVRSTISDYLSILEEIGLVQRKRVSRQSLVSLTENGKDFIKSAQEEIDFIEGLNPKAKKF